jgi:hypothetical protein
MPNNTKTSVMLIVDVIFALKDLKDDTFLLFDITVLIDNPASKVHLSQIRHKVTKNIAETENNRQIF